jgi:hypothetical protein
VRSPQRIGVRSIDLPNLAASRYQSAPAEQ